jgi:hypothetical protein
MAGCQRCELFLAPVAKGLEVTKTAATRCCDKVAKAVSRLLSALAAGSLLKSKFSDPHARGSDQGRGIGVNRRREIITGEFRSA